MLDFPNSPVNGQLFNVGSISWRWDGSKWVVNSAAAEGGGDITGVIAGTGLAGGGSVGEVTLNLAVPVTVPRGGTGLTSFPITPAGIALDGTLIGGQGTSPLAMLSNAYGTIGYWAADNSAGNLVYAGWGTDPYIQFYRANGNATAPTPVVNDDYLGGMWVMGHTLGGPTPNRVWIAARASENWTGTAQGARLEFATTPIGGTGTATRLTLTGTMLTANTGLTVAGAATFSSTIANGVGVPTDNSGAQAFLYNTYLANATLGFNIYWGTNNPSGWKHLTDQPGGYIYVTGGGEMTLATTPAGTVGSPSPMTTAVKLGLNGGLAVGSQTLPADHNSGHAFVQDLISSGTVAFNLYYSTSGWKSLNTNPGIFIQYDGSGNLVFAASPAGTAGRSVTPYTTMYLTPSGLLNITASASATDLAPPRMSAPSNSDNFIRYSSSREIGVGLKSDGTFMVFDYSGLSTRISLGTDNVVRIYGYTISSDFRSDANCYVPNGFIYAGTSFQSPSTNYPNASISVGYLTGIALRFIQNAGDEGSSGSISSRVHDGGALCVVGVGTNGTNRRVKIWDQLDIAGRINTPYLWSSGDAQFDGTTYFGGGGNFRNYWDGNGHIECNATLWLNHDTGQEVHCSGRFVCDNTICRSQGGSGGFEVGDRSFQSDWTIYTTSSHLRLYNGTDRVRFERDGYVYFQNHILPMSDNNIWCGVDVWGLSWYVVSCYNAHNPSDRRLKRDIDLLPDCLGIVDALSPKRYFMINDPEEDKWRRHWGFVAQEVGEVMYNAGYDFSSGYYIGKNPDTGEETHSLNYNDITAVLWKAVQELSAKVKQLEARG